MTTEHELREALARLTRAVYAGRSSGEHGNPLFSIPPQPGNADVLLAGAIDELIALRASLREIAAIEDTDPVRRGLRLALAECVAVMRYDAHGGDGWSEEGYRALGLAAPLLGIDIVRTSTGDEMGEEFKFLLDPPIEAVADALRRGAS